MAATRALKATYEEARAGREAAEALSPLLIVLDPAQPGEGSPLQEVTDLLATILRGLLSHGARSPAACAPPPHGGAVPRGDRAHRACGRRTGGSTRRACRQHRQTSRGRPERPGGPPGCRTDSTPLGRPRARLGGTRHSAPPALAGGCSLPTVAAPAGPSPRTRAATSARPTRSRWAATAAVLRPGVRLWPKSASRLRAAASSRT